MRVILITDAWQPQINGVVRVYERLHRELESLGVKVRVISPLDFPTVPMPGYPEIRLALSLPADVGRQIDRMPGEFVHIASEGPIGMAARHYCMAHGIVFTTSYHTRFPEYLAARLPVSESVTYCWLRRFHNAGNGVMVATDSLARDLRGRGFERILTWTRGVDCALFHRDRREATPWKGPVSLYVGRLAVEKGIDDFLSLDLPGSKVVVGDGPQRAELEARYRDAVFLGSLEREALARAYASADVFVIPSRTDTFGLVMLEALASGVPVAAYPVMGPIDVIGGSGALCSAPEIMVNPRHFGDKWSRKRPGFFQGFGSSDCRNSPASIRRSRGARS